ncbi:cAMP-dependent protein kinase type 2 [Fusarium odoratissimum]|uniref:cAMP-dependent protein kinase n=2 Tax=Fusarium oxysporum species complex TaxID=171631 RepID=N1RE94_FUSC4|nr:cAMP-dependent protein kinase type 2 [Fusarium odoratissimum]ENH64322.1 cAMP-dependent protein kinase type 2 [Fusarium oxysporum f. sp. cubense race 1]
MPSLGFLKKKRTREGNSDPSASSPTSPVTPTTSRSKSISKAFHLPRTSRQSTSAPSAQPTNGQNQQQQQQPDRIQEGAVSQSNQSSAPNEQTTGATDGQQQEDMSAINLHQPSYGAGSPMNHDHQNLPSINNLINPPQQQQQHNAQGNSYNNGQTNPHFGRVHLVQSKHNQRFYAVKVLKKAQVVKMKQVEHTNDERRMLADVKHPFLITLWGTFQDPKNLYMVMDFVEGGELFSLLRKSGRFPNPVAKFYAAEVTLALEYLHSKNIIYRDLKPENLLLDRHGHLKITDFGFAKRVPDKTWTLCGTPDYLAPEVVSNKGYNKSVDWWSLGILIYEMLCGYTPFWDSGSPMKIYENILKGKVKYPAYVNADAQNLLERLITADLTKRLGNLYGGPDDVKTHPWFAEVTWDRLARKDIDAPYTPPVKAGAGDASQFDRYPEDPEKYGVVTAPDEYGHMFTEF